MQGPGVLYYTGGEIKTNMLGCPSQLLAIDGIGYFQHFANPLANHKKSGDLGDQGSRKILQIVEDLNKWQIISVEKPSNDQNQVYHHKKGILDSNDA